MNFFRSVRRFFRTLVISVIVVVVVAGILAGFLTIVFYAGKPSEKGSIRDVVNGLTGKSCELSTLSADMYGYVTVKQGQEIWFPVKDQSDDPASFGIGDYFEVFSVLGNPKDAASELTNFQSKDLWLLLRICKAKQPLFLVLQVKWQHDYGMPEETMDCLDRLSGMFKNADFIDKTGQPVIKSTGIFLYLVRCHYEDDCAEDDEPFNGVEYKDRLIAIVEERNSDCPLFAKTFDSAETGRLLVVLDQSRKKPLEKVSVSKWFSYSYYMVGYQLSVRLVSQENVKCRPELDKALPDPSAFWLKSTFIDYGEKSSKER